MLKKIIIGAIFIVLGLFVYNFIINPKGTTIGQQAPLFDATLVNGDSFNLGDLKGKYVLVDFWGSWCAPCLKEFPELRNMYERFNTAEFKDADGFEIVSIALEKTDDKTRDIITRQGLNWPYHIIDVSRIVLMSSYAQLYGVSEVPTKVLINPDGAVMGTNLTFEEIDRLLNERI